MAALHSPEDHGCPVALGECGEECDVDGGVAADVYRRHQRGQVARVRQQVVTVLEVTIFIRCKILQNIKTELRMLQQYRYTITVHHAM